VSLRILDTDLEEEIQDRIVKPLSQREYDSAIRNIPDILDELYAKIPDSKRGSYGMVYTLRVLSDHLYSRLVKIDAQVYRIASDMFEKSSDFKAKGVSLGILSLYGLGDCERVLPYFKSAAASPCWQVRELAQMFFRKLIKEYPDEMKEYLLGLVKSEDPNVRRFVGEALRPVGENRWFYKNPDYPLSVLRNMFKESSPYPRTSVGNNLSDLARQCPELVYDLVRELVESGDRNSYWIAYRACRNLVRKDPIKVMNLLKADEYRYKERIHRRSKHSGNE